MSDKNTTYQLLSGTFARVEKGELVTYKKEDTVQGPVPENLVRNKMIPLAVETKTTKKVETEAEKEAKAIKKAEAAEAKKKARAEAAAKKKADAEKKALGS